MRYTPRLLARLLGQARNWGGFVQGGGGGGGAGEPQGAPRVSMPVVCVQTLKIRYTGMTRERWNFFFSDSGSDHNVSKITHNICKHVTKHL